MKQALLNQRSQQHLQCPLVHSPPSNKNTEMWAFDTLASVTPVTTLSASKLSAKGSLGYDELKQHKSRFYERCSQLLRLKETNQTAVDVRYEPNEWG